MKALAASAILMMLNGSVVGAGNNYRVEHNISRIGVALYSPTIIAEPNQPAYLKLGDDMKLKTEVRETADHAAIVSLWLEIEGKPHELRLVAAPGKTGAIRPARHRFPLSSIQTDGLLSQDRPPTTVSRRYRGS